MRTTAVITLALCLPIPAVAENRREIMALGATRPLDDALRIAYGELIDWILSAASSAS